MRTTRKLKKWLIFALAFLIDVYKEFSIRNYYRALYLPGYEPKKESLSQLVSRMIKFKEIERIEEDGEVYLKLTSKGGRFFNEKISLQKLSQKEWDKIWRLVIFDIKEIERNIRDQLRRMLKSWGFAMWQESVYISPHPILKEVDEFLKMKKLFPKVVSLESKIVGVKNNRKFAWVIFKLGELKKEYLLLGQEIKKLNKKKMINGREVKEILERFQALLFKDPFLPKGLIDSDWPREKTRSAIKQLLTKV